MPTLFPILFAALIAIVGILVPFYIMYRTISWVTGPDRIPSDWIEAIAIVVSMLLLMGFSVYAAARTYQLLSSIAGGL